MSNIDATISSILELSFKFRYEFIIITFSTTRVRCFNSFYLSPIIPIAFSVLVTKYRFFLSFMQLSSFSHFNRWFTIRAASSDIEEA